MKKITLLLLLGLTLAGCGQFGLVGSTTNVSSNHVSQRKVAPAPTETTQYQVENRDVTRDGKKLVGHLYRPQGVEQAPLVIFSHELSSTQASGKRYAKFLASRGIATYIFDFGGGSPKSQSDGDTSQMSIVTEEADLEAILQDSKTWDHINHDKVTLMGASQGGVVSSLIASQHPDEIAGLVLLYPAFIIPEMVKNTYHSLDEVPEHPSYLGALNLGRNYVTDIWGMDVYKEIAKYPRNVLILHGSQDRIVPFVYSERAQESYPHAELFQIKGAGHGFSDSYFDQAGDDIWDYLVANQLNQ